jgi:hypothetical protein
MMEHYWLAFIALGLYVISVGFCFCDGFGLHIGRKLVWFFVLVLISGYVLRTRGEFDLAYILPLPAVLVVVLGKLELLRRQRRGAKVTLTPSRGRDEVKPKHQG